MPDKPKKMNEDRLVALLREKLAKSEDSYSALTDVRAHLLERYFGEKYGNEQQDQSDFVSRDMMEVVEWMKPPLVRGFLGSSNVVSFEPTGPDDETLAQQETDIVNYRLMKANGGDGFEALVNFITDALLYPVAYAKVYIDEKEEEYVHEVSGLNQLSFAHLVQQEGVEPLEIRTYEEDVNGMPQQLVDVRYRETKNVEDLVIESVPPEDVFVDHELANVNLDHARFVAQKYRKTFTELVQMGFDRGKLKETPPSAYDELEEGDIVKSVRDVFDRHYGIFDGSGDDDSDLTERVYDVYECFLWVDYDGRGVGQFRRVVMIGNNIFENEEVDYQPLVAMSSVLVPHRHYGLSLAQMVEDYQRLHTYFARAIIDNIHRNGLHRMFVSRDALIEGDITLEALADREQTTVLIDGSPNEVAMMEPVNNLLADLLNITTASREMMEVRAGVPLKGAVDTDVNQNTPYGAFMAASDKAGERQELIARTMAETGFKQLFRKAHRLCRSSPDIVTAVKLRGEWVAPDVSVWQERTDVSVNVGLGFASRQQMVLLVTQLLEVAERVAPKGLADEKGGYQLLKELVEAMGVGATDRFFNDPTQPDWQPPQPPPDPSLIAAQGDAMYKQAAAQMSLSEIERQNVELQHKIQIDQQKLQLDQTKMQLEAEKLQADLRKAEAEAHVKSLDAALKEREQELKTAEARLKRQATELEAIRTSADVENTEADTALKEAQATKVLAETGRTAEEVERTAAETQRTVAEVDKVDAETVATLRSDSEGSGEGSDE